MNNNNKIKLSLTGMELKNMTEKQFNKSLYFAWSIGLLFGISSLVGSIDHLIMALK